MGSDNEPQLWMTFSFMGQILPRTKGDRTGASQRTRLPHGRPTLGGRVAPSVDFNYVLCTMSGASEAPGESLALPHWRRRLWAERKLHSRKAMGLLLAPLVGTQAGQRTAAGATRAHCRNCRFSCLRIPPTGPSPFLRRSRGGRGCRRHCVACRARHPCRGGRVWHMHGGPVH